MDGNAEAKQRLKKLSSGDLAIFCFQLSLILKAGIPLNEGLGTLGDETLEMAESKQKIRGILGKTIRNMAAEVEIGAPLSHAMKKKGVFPGYMVSMIEIGEGTGKLDSVLEALGDYYERDQYVKTKVRNAMMYPVFLFVIMSVVIVLLVGRVFPIFSGMIESMGGSLSESQQAVSAFAGSLAAGTYTMYIILGLAALVVVFALLAKTKAGKAITGQLAAVFPLTKNINKKIAASRFANAMSMTLSSGMDVNSALNMSVNLIDNFVFKARFTQCVKEIEEGGSFAKAIGKTGAFSGMYLKFIEIGQKTGTLDGVMKKVADICDGEADTSLNNATSLIEPLLVGVLSVVIGVILISVMIPLVSVMSNIS